MSRDQVYLAFDYGEKRIGVAIGNTLTAKAQPLLVIENKSKQFRFEAIEKLLKEWQPNGLVVGVPSYPDGGKHLVAKWAKRFGHQLHERYRLPIFWVDERYSSIEAERQLHQAQHSRNWLDAYAACVILQQFFDTGMHKS